MQNNKSRRKDLLLTFRRKRGMHDNQRKLGTMGEELS